MAAARAGANDVPPRNRADTRALRVQQETQEIPGRNDYPPDVWRTVVPDTMYIWNLTMNRIKHIYELKHFPAHFDIDKRPLLLTILLDNDEHVTR